jgi:hypothetical protein
LDWDWLLNTVPALPSDGLLRVARPLMWAVVVAAASAWVTVTVWRSGPEAQGRRVARWVAACCAAWCLLPSPWSLAHHLSLAFMLPSWTTVLLCGMSLWRSSFAINSKAKNPQKISGKSPLFLKLLWAGAFILGTVLLADTFILLPFALYRWGFGTAVVATLALLAAVAWVSTAPGSVTRAQASVVALALVFHVVTRLPSGNVFDAVIDPLLWMWLLVSGLKRFRGASAAAATTTRG